MNLRDILLALTLKCIGFAVTYIEATLTLELYVPGIKQYYKISQLMNHPDQRELV